MKRKRYVKKSQMGTIPERISAREYERTMKDAALLACSQRAKKLAEGLYEYAIDPEAEVEVFLSLLQRSFKQYLEFAKDSGYDHFLPEFDIKLAFRNAISKAVEEIGR